VETLRRLQDVEIEDQLAHLLLEPLDLLILERIIFTRAGAKSVLRAEEKPLLPVFDLRDLEIVFRAASAMDVSPFRYAVHERHAPLRCPALQVLRNSLCHRSRLPVLSLSTVLRVASTRRGAGSWLVSTPTANANVATSGGSERTSEAPRVRSHGYG
jgi:hypothetical protein